MLGTDFLRKIIRLSIIPGLLLASTDPALAYDPKAKQISLDTSNFDNNLDGTVNDVQELADAVDELSTSTPETDPVVAAISGIVKSNGSTISAAVSGTDYAPATSGTSILKGNGSGGFSAASAGSDYLATEVDGVVGNEIANVTDATLTRSGSGTGGSPYTLGLNVSNANTWTGQQTFNTSAPIFGTMTQGSALFAGSSGLLSQDNQNYRFDDTYNRLSIFDTLDSEILTNGNFTSNASGWTVPSGMAWSSGAVSKTSNGTGALTQAITAHITSEYLLTYTISNWTAGTVTPSFGGWTGTAVSADGTYTERFVATSATNLVAFTPSNTARFTIDTISMKKLIGTNTKSNLNVGGLMVQGSWSNSGPGTTRAQTFNNIGTHTWTDYRFAASLRAAIGANSSGGVDIHSSGSNYFALYGGNTGLTSSSLYMYSTPSGLFHYGMGVFGGKVGAGSNSTPTATLQSAGSTALKVKRITSSQALDATATHWLCDASSAACTGTPSASCSSWTNQTDCEKWDAHGGCSWFAGYSCSVYDNEYGMGSCSGQSGCTPSESSCSEGGAYDQYSCEALDDSYGGNCTWDNNPIDCSTYNPTDQWTCEGAGCSYYDPSCSSYNGDQSSCESNGCYYDSGTTNCVGMCSGSIDSYSCNGNYYTGTCAGNYGSACSGTAACSGIDDSTNCGNETGCTWATALNVTLPAITSYPDMTYWIYNDSSSGADVNILPNGTDTVNGTTSVVLANYKDGVHVAPLRVTASCSSFNEGACTPTGCSINYCYWNGMECSGGASCTGVGDEETCNTTFDYCSGTYVVSSNWYVWSRT